MFLYQAEAVREIDRVAIEEHGVPGITLMRRAAAACVNVLLESISSPAKVAVICGSGNNAGDGFIVAGMLANKGLAVSVCLVGREPDADTDAGQALAFCKESAARFEPFVQTLDGADVIVDALLGTGTKGEVRPAFAEAIRAINSATAFVLSVDLPSGLNADTGTMLDPCVTADTTVTFIANKIGLMTGDGPEVTGRLAFADLGVDAASVESVSPIADVLDYKQLKNTLPKRHRNAHKMQHGHLLVVGGNNGMAGAAAMAAEAALYSGAGMVTAATHPASAEVVVSRRPEVMARGIVSEKELAPLIERCTAVVIGPGLGRDEWAAAVHAMVLDSELPLVIDADGLNLLAAAPQSRKNWVLTPHPGEAARLLGTKSAAVQMDRVAAVKNIQDRYGGTALLKGAGTLVQDDCLSLCPYGNPGMSVAGMGDVLSGVIGGLLVQGLGPAIATRLGAVLHSLAADRIVSIQGERGLLATELLPVIRELVNGEHD